MKKIFALGIALLVGLMISGNTTVFAADLGLIQLLTSNLGVTKKQATGGAGSIFNLAKQNMSTDDFTKLAKSVPGINKMMAAAPKTDGASSMLGSASSLLGGKTASSVSGVAGLAGSFSKLGMNADMVNSFMPIIMDYVKAKGGEPLAAILQAALQ
ncbi:MAG TPA: DUF2780 domain-containing protein [Smithellaceae bacterium]|nr:DUF2780 domain-containing protein [Smithellaceae bacterium]